MKISSKYVTDGWSAGHTVSKITLPLPEDPNVRSKFGLKENDGGNYFSFMMDTKDVVRKTEMERDVLFDGNPKRTGFECSILDNPRDNRPKSTVTVSSDVIENAVETYRKEYNARMTGVSTRTNPYPEVDGESKSNDGRQMNCY